MIHQEGMEAVVDWAIDTVTPEDFWLDVGANRGYITERLLEKVTPRETLLVEPFPQGELPMVEKIVLDKPGRRIMYKVETPECSTIYDRYREHEREVVEVEVTTIDELMNGVGAPIVMKLDVEYSEHLALMGAIKTIPKIRAMCVEIIPSILKEDIGVDPAEFIKKIDSWGFIHRRIDDYNLVFQRVNEITSLGTGR